MHPRKVENCSNCTDQVIFRDSILETKRIKQLLLLFQSPHHCSPPTRIASEQGNHCSLESPKSFATKSALLRLGSLLADCLLIEMKLTPCKSGRKAESDPTRTSAVTDSHPCPLP